MSWACQLPLRICIYLRGNRLLRAAVFAILLLLYCEWGHYYVVLLCCTWPNSDLRHLDVNVPPPSSGTHPLKFMVLGDTHLLGSRKGHWFDKLRREWQMQRAFQTAMQLHSPDVVFVLGDIMDEGEWCDDAEFRYHVERFLKMFAVPSHSTMHVLVGNHDIGFHNAMSEWTQDRFEKAFAAPSVQLLEIKGNLFILINSMALEGDGCSLCQEAVLRLQEVSEWIQCAEGYPKAQPSALVCSKWKRLTYSRPVILQHFPMFRTSDLNCSTPDAAPEIEKAIKFRPRWDSLSLDATNQLLDWFDPRLILTAHTHHGCFTLHKNGASEWTVASFNWRNKQNPSFLLISLQTNSFAVNQCMMPDERTVLTIYITGILLILLSLLLPHNGRKFSNKFQ